MSASPTQVTRWPFTFALAAVRRFITPTTRFPTSSAFPSARLRTLVSGHRPSRSTSDPSIRGSNCPKTFRTRRCDVPARRRSAGRRRAYPLIRTAPPERRLITTELGDLRSDIRASLLDDVSALGRQPPMDTVKERAVQTGKSTLASRCDSDGKASDGSRGVPEISVACSFTSTLLYLIRARTVASPSATRSIRPLRAARVAL